MPFAFLNFLHPGQEMDSTAKKVRSNTSKANQTISKENPFQDLIKKLKKDEHPKDDSFKKTKFSRKESSQEQTLWQLGGLQIEKTQAQLQSPLPKSQSKILVKEEDQIKTSLTGKSQRREMPNQDTSIQQNNRLRKEFLGEEKGFVLEKKFKKPEKILQAKNYYVEPKDLEKSPLFKTSSPNLSEEPPKAKISPEQMKDLPSKDIFPKESKDTIGLTSSLDRSKEKLTDSASKMFPDKSLQTLEGRASKGKEFFENLIKEKESKFETKTELKPELELIKPRKDREVLFFPEPLKQHLGDEKPKLVSKSGQAKEIFGLEGNSKGEQSKGKASSLKQEITLENGFKESNGKEKLSLWGTTRDVKDENKKINEKTSEKGNEKKKTSPFNELLVQGSQGEIGLGEIKGEVKAQNLKGTTPYPMPPPQQEIMDQIIDRIQITSFGQREEMEIKLKPEYLGGLKLKVSLEDGQMKATFLVENPLVKEVLEANMDALKSFLQNENSFSQGIEVDIKGESNQEHGQRETDFAQRTFSGFRSSSERSPEPLRNNLLQRQLDYKI